MPLHSAQPQVIVRDPLGPFHDLLSHAYYSGFSITSADDRSQYNHANMIMLNADRALSLMETQAHNFAVYGQNTSREFRFILLQVGAANDAVTVLDDQIYIPHTDNPSSLNNLDYDFGWVYGSRSDRVWFTHDSQITRIDIDLANDTFTFTAPTAFEGVFARIAYPMTDDITVTCCGNASRFAVFNAATGDHWWITGLSTLNNMNRRHLFPLSDTTAATLVRNNSSGTWDLYLQVWGFFNNYTECTMLDEVNISAYMTALPQFSDLTYYDSASYNTLVVSGDNIHIFLSGSAEDGTYAWYQRRHVHATWDGVEVQFQSTQVLESDADDPPLLSIQSDFGLKPIACPDDGTFDLRNLRQRPFHLMISDTCIAVHGVHGWGGDNNLLIWELQIDGADVVNKAVNWLESIPMDWWELPEGDPWHATDEARKSFYRFDESPPYRFPDGKILLSTVYNEYNDAWEDNPETTPDAYTASFQYAQLVEPEGPEVIDTKATVRVSRSGWGEWIPAEETSIPRTNTEGWQ